MLELASGAVVSERKIGASTCSILSLSFGAKGGGTSQYETGSHIFKCETFRGQDLPACRVSPFPPRHWASFSRSFFRLLGLSKTPSSKNNISFLNMRASV